jgi:hypothetical protein
LGDICTRSHCPHLIVKQGKTSVDEIRVLCNTCDVILLQETWLTSHDLPYLNTLDGGFYYMGVPPCLLRTVFSEAGRMVIEVLYGTSEFAHMCKIIEYEDCWIIGIESNSDNKKLLALNIYLHYENDENESKTYTIINVCSLDNKQQTCDK